MNSSEILALILKKLESIEQWQEKAEQNIKDGFKEAEVRDEELDKQNAQRFVKIETKIENVLEPHLQLHGEVNSILRDRLTALEQEKEVVNGLHNRIKTQEGVSQILATRIDTVEERVTTLEKEKNVG